jgi:vacuolar-type H+-ATPase subunit E/Vma4
MPLEDILEKIEAKAAQNAEIIENEARKEAEGIIKEANEESTREIEEARKKNEKRKREEIGRIEALERIELKKRILEAKRRAVEEVLDGAIEKFCNSKDYEEFLKKLKSEIDKDVEKVTINKRDKKVFEEIKQMEEGSIKGGAIIIKKDMVIDNSIESLLERKRSRLEREIEQILFGEKK